MKNARSVARGSRNSRRVFVDWHGRMVHFDVTHSASINPSLIAFSTASYLLPHCSFPIAL